MILRLKGKRDLGLKRKIAEITIKNIPNMNLRRVCDRSFTIVAPIKLRTKLGMPNNSKTFLSRPCLKNAILPMFPKKWNMATKTNAVLKSKK
jgi:hypothetical protein